MSAAPSFTVASTMTKLKLEAVSCYERDVTLRLPFRFGVITVTRATQAVIRATIALPDGRTSVGVAVGRLPRKRFAKNPNFRDPPTLEHRRPWRARPLAHCSGA